MWLGEIVVKDSESLPYEQVVDARGFSSLPRENSIPNFSLLIYSFYKHMKCLWHWLNYVLMDPQVPKSARFAEGQHTPKASLCRLRQTSTNFAFHFKHKQDLSNLKWDSSVIKKCLTRDKKPKPCPTKMHLLFFLPFLYLMLWDVCNGLNPHLFLAFLLTFEKKQWIIKGFIVAMFCHGMCNQHTPH